MPAFSINKCPAQLLRQPSQDTPGQEVLQRRRVHEWRKGRQTLPGRSWQLAGHYPTPDRIQFIATRSALFMDGVMARWITFDQQTFSLLRARLSQGASIETFGRGALDYALAKPGSVVALLPLFEGAQVGLAVFRPQPRPTAVQPVKTLQPMPKIGEPLSSRGITRAGGFLGLSDEPVFEDEQPEEKKSWWRRFWDE